MTAIISRAEDLTNELRSRIEAIQIDNGCETDIGKMFFAGRRKIDDNVPPCSVLVEGEDTAKEMAGKTLTEARVEIRYVLIGYDKCDPNHPNTQAHKIIRDLKRAIFRTDDKASGNLGGRVRSVAYRGRDIGPRADGIGIVMAVVEIGVELAEDLANP